MERGGSSKETLSPSHRWLRWSHSPLVPSPSHFSKCNGWLKSPSMNLTKHSSMSALFLRIVVILFVSLTATRVGAVVMTNATFTKITTGNIVSDHGNTYS